MFPPVTFAMKENAKIKIDKESFPQRKQRMVQLTKFNDA
jgi:hypothetical protein